MNDLTKLIRAEFLDRLDDMTDGEPLDVSTIEDEFDKFITPKLDILIEAIDQTLGAVNIQVLHRAIEKVAEIGAS